MEGGEHDGEHTLGSLGALFKLEAAEDKVVATNDCGGLFDEIFDESDIGATLLFPVTPEVRVIVFTTVDPTWIGVEVEVPVGVAEESGLIAMIFLPPDPVMNTSCLPVACSEAAKAGGTIICLSTGFCCDCPEDAIDEDVEDWEAADGDDDSVADDMIELVS